MGISIFLGDFYFFGIMFPFKMVIFPLKMMIFQLKIVIFPFLDDFPWQTVSHDQRVYYIYIYGLWIFKKWLEKVLCGLILFYMELYMDSYGLIESFRWFKPGINRDYLHRKGSRDWFAL